MLRCQISGPKINYDITFKSRYTVITGCSASGKSFLVDVSINNEHHPGYRVRLSDEDYMLVAGKLGLRLVLRDSGYHNGKYVFIIDDDDLELSGIFHTLLADCVNSYFIVMTRNEYVPNLNYGLRDVYEIVKVGQTDIFVSAFTYNREPVVREDTVIITEDSNSGFMFYSELFKDNTTLCITDKNGNISGKDSLISMLYRMRNTLSSVMLFVDWCSFGSYVQRLSSLVSVQQNALYLLPDIHSFEFLLLSTNMLDFESNESDMLSSLSQEKYYEDILEGKTRGTEFYQKHGNKLKECYYKPCCVKQDVISCRGKLFGKDKFVALLKGTEFEILLELSGRL